MKKRIPVVLPREGKDQKGHCTNMLPNGITPKEKLQPIMQV
jgi:hypothetical protein